MAHSIPKSQFDGGDSGPVGPDDRRHVAKSPRVSPGGGSVGSLQCAGQNPGMDDAHG